jgi:3-carboxy-cis,cis-muconate cycloisomerase
MSDGGLLGGIFAHGPVAPQVSERAFLQAMLDVEVALAGALASVGIATEAAASEIAGAADASALDLDEIGRSAGAQGTPVTGMLSALRERLSDDAAAHLHEGATSQDIVDTALMLVAHRALEPLIGQLAAAADACAGLAERHRATLAPGRTLIQQALPITFGLKAAQWLVALDESRAELSEIRAHVLAVQFGGAVGTLAPLGDRGLEVSAAIAAQLGLAEPTLPWHTVRLRPARLACALAAALGAMGKIARDVILLAQTEVAEAAEAAADGRGGSSTMPHKRNPVGVVAVVACSQRGPGLVSTILSAMVQEHERAAGAWQAEWEPQLELLRLTGSASAILAEVLAALVVDPERMREDLNATGDLLMSESVAAALTPSLGRPAAQKLVGEAARTSAQDGRAFADVLRDVPEVQDRLGQAGLERALDPRQYLGVSDELITRALEAHRAVGRPA